VLTGLERRAVGPNLIFSACVLMLPSEHCVFGLYLLETAVVSTKSNKMLPALKDINVSLDPEIVRF